MRFGERESFAVELELAEEPGGAWLFGHFCYWIEGVRVGDYDLSTSLRDVLSGMKWIARDRGRRDGGRLCEISTDEMFARLDEAIYGEGGDQPEEPARFEITVPVEVFNGWKVFLVECGAEALVLCKWLPAGDLRVSSLRPGVFDEAFDAAYRYLDGLHERAVSAEPPGSTADLNKQGPGES